MKIGYLGPKGTFSHQAALQYAQKISDGELIAFGTIPECLMAVDNGDTDTCIVPFENSIEGTVTYTIDSLIFDVNLIIEEELILPIRHFLVARDGTKKEDIEKIYSHPQALAQCKKKLQNDFHGIDLVQISSTAEGARVVSGNDEKIGAICNEAAAKEFGVNILEEDMQDDEHNETRFLILSKNGKKEPMYEGKTTIVFGTDNKPGELYKILDIIAIWDLNMTKIESRPRKNELGKYVFYIDMESKNAADIRDAIKMIERKTSFFKHLGTYYTTQ